MLTSRSKLTLREHVGRLVRFALVSGTGLALDLALFVALVTSGVVPFAGSVVSSSAAVTIVYFASVRRVFRYRGRFVPSMFAAYACYQACGIILGSWSVSALVEFGLVPTGAKIAILPLTFSANYLFMWWLTSSPERWVRAR